MGQYDNHLVNGAALEQVIEDVHGDQQRQDEVTASISDNMPTPLDVLEIADLWNNN